MLFTNFLREYIKDLIDCSPDEYEMTEADINDIANLIASDEHLWDAIDWAIYDAIDGFRKELEEDE